MRKTIRPSFFWRFVKIAGFWFIFAQGALILAPRFDTSPAWYVYVAMVAFALQSVAVLVSVLGANGLSWRLFFGAGVCIAVGIGLFSTVPLLQVGEAAGPDWLFRSIAGLVEGRNRIFGSPQPMDHLAAAAKLIFEKGTQESLAEARQHLLSIPQPAAEYRSAQALLHVAQSRQNQAKIRKKILGKEKTSIEIIASEQTRQGFRVTLRNNLKKSIRNIRYHVSYFRAVDGSHIEPDKESLISREFSPHETSNVEFSDKHAAQDLVYGAFTVVSWEVVPVF
jgi:hypothetical protein